MLSNWLLHEHYHYYVDLYNIFITELQFAHHIPSKFQPHYHSVEVKNHAFGGYFHAIAEYLWLGWG